MRKIVRIFTVSSKITFKMKKDRTHAKTVIEANTDYHAGDRLGNKMTNIYDLA